MCVPLIIIIIIVSVFVSCLPWFNFNIDQTDQICLNLRIAHRELRK